MSRIVFDAVGEKGFRYGVSKMVLYPMTGTTYAKGVPFNGITAINENPSGADENAIYADNIKYASIYSNEEYGCGIEALWYPPEFAECDGEKSVLSGKKGVYVGQQKRRPFGFCYRNEVGNDTYDEEDDGYELHMVWCATAKPSSKSHKTVNTSVDNETESWDISTVPTPVTVKDASGKDMRPTAHIRVNTAEYEDKDIIAKLEDILYGDDTHEPTLPTPDQVLRILNGEDVDVYGTAA